MKKTILSLLIAAVAFLVVGCATPPTKEMEAAKTALETVVAEGGQKYAIQEVNALNEDYAKALAEIKSQENEFLKDYKAAEALLKKVIEDATAAQQLIPGRKETAKKNAELALTATQAKIAETAALLAEAPQGKGSEMDIAALQQDLNGLNEALAEVTGMIQAENYLSVPDKVAQIQTKAGEIAAEIKAAIEKRAAMENERKEAEARKAAEAKKKTETKKPAAKKGK